MIHPWLLGIFPILSLYSHNIYELPLQIMAVPIVMSLGATAVIWLIFRVWSRDTPRSGLATSLCVVSFFGYRSLENSLDASWAYLNELWVPCQTQIPPPVSLCLDALLTMVGCWLIFRRIGRPATWTSFLNLFTLILIVIPTVNVIANRFHQISLTRSDPNSTATGRQRGWTPDIYFIIMDGYSRSDVMMDNYGFDNQAFLERLERRGFFVARQSTSNYCHTPLSLCSTLNFNYLDTLVDLNSHDLLPLSDRIKNNRINEQLRARGYKTVSFATGFDPTEIPDSDIYLSLGHESSAFYDLLIGMTPLWTILQESQWMDRFTHSRNRTLFIMNRLPSITKIPGPTFTFAHILSPHPPYLFGENGEDVSPRSFLVNNGKLVVNKHDPFVGTAEYVRQAYRNQAMFLTKRIEATIDQILKQSPEPPVIILQSDHGGFLHFYSEDLEATDIRERMGTLYAVYIPGKKYEGLTDQAVSVNTFRIVLNNLFETKLPLLEPRNYFSTGENPLKFIDVTERLHSAREKARKFKSPASFLGLTMQLWKDFLQPTLLRKTGEVAG